MRKTAISDDIENATELKELFQLSEEIKDLLFKCLKTDKRKLRNEQDKARFKGRLNLYCTLYKRTRVRFLEIKKKGGGTSYYRTPLEFEELIIDFNWERTIRYSQPASNVVLLGETIETEEPEEEIVEQKDTYVTIDQLKQEFLSQINTIMAKKIFNRKDPAVISAALEATLSEFLAQFDGTTTKDVLEKAYHDLRKNNKVPNTGTEEPLAAGAAKPEAKAETAKDAEKPLIVIVGDRIHFKFDDGTKLNGTVVAMPTETEERYEVKGDDNLNYQVKKEKIISVLEAKKVAKAPEAKKDTVTTTTVAPTTETTTVGEQGATTETTTAAPAEATDVTTTAAPAAEKVRKPRAEKVAADTPMTGEGAPSFKLFPTEVKKKVVREYYEKGYLTTGDVKKQMEADGYIIEVFQDIYHVMKAVLKDVADAAGGVTPTTTVAPVTETTTVAKTTTSTTILVEETTTTTTELQAEQTTEATTVAE